MAGCGGSKASKHLALHRSKVSTKGKTLPSSHTVSCPNLLLSSHPLIGFCCLRTAAMTSNACNTKALLLVVMMMLAMCAATASSDASGTELDRTAPSLELYKLKFQRRARVRSVALHMAFLVASAESSCLSAGARRGLLQTIGNCKDSHPNCPKGLYYCCFDVQSFNNEDCKKVADGAFNPKTCKLQCVNSN